MNRHNLSERFLFTALFRKYLRTRSKISTFDIQDQLFFLLFCTHILVGIFLLGQLEKPSLRFIECQFLCPLLCAYLYVCTKKLFRSKYFHHFMFFLILLPSFPNFFVLVDLFWGDGCLLVHHNEQEAGIIGQTFYTIYSKFFYNVNNKTFCIPNDVSVVECFSKTNHNKSVPAEVLNDAFWNSTMRGLATSTSFYVLTKNPRVTYTVGISTVIFSFVTDILTKNG